MDILIIAVFIILLCLVAPNSSGLLGGDPTTKP